MTYTGLSRNFNINPNLDKPIKKLTSGFLAPISEVSKLQNRLLFHPGKGGKQAKIDVSALKDCWGTNTCKMLTDYNQIQILPQPAILLH